MVTPNLNELRAAFNDTVDLIEAHVREVRAEYEHKIDMMVVEFRKSISTTTHHLEGERDEARRHVKALMEEIRTLKMQQAPVVRTFGTALCQQPNCRKPFDKLTAHQRTCGDCKSAKGRALAASRHGVRNEPLPPVSQ